ncbi:unnamed protein product, partial [Ectocarpus sp. 13 AM-2016]
DFRWSKRPLQAPCHQTLNWPKFLVHGKDDRASNLVMPQTPPTRKSLSKGGRQTTPAASLSRTASKPRPLPTHGHHLHLLHWAVQPPSTPTPAPHQRLCPMVHWYSPREPQARKTHLRQASVPGPPGPSSPSVALFPKQGPLQHHPAQPRRCYNDSARHQGA